MTQEESRAEEARLKQYLSSFRRITYDDFRVRAADPELDHYGKIGTPPFYREGKEEAIFADILGKLRNLRGTGKTVLEIGPGCSELPKLLMSHCEKQGHRLILADSEEMLRLLPSTPCTSKISGRFPDTFGDFLESHRGCIDVVLCYSMFQSVFLDMNPYIFLDKAVGLLKPGGELLLGDLPNLSMKNRFLLSAAGTEFHKKFMRTDQAPEIDVRALQEECIDDSVILSFVRRYRDYGFDVYLLPQSQELPYANRREDLLIRRP